MPVVCQKILRLVLSFGSRDLTKGCEVVGRWGQSEGVEVMDAVEMMSV